MEDFMWTPYSTDEAATNAQFAHKLEGRWSLLSYENSPLLDIVVRFLWRSFKRGIQLHVGPSSGFRGFERSSTLNRIYIQGTCSFSDSDMGEFELKNFN